MKYVAHRVPILLDRPHSSTQGHAEHCISCLDQGDYDCCRVEQPEPAEAAAEVGHSDGEPITGREALKVWLVMCAPALGSAALLALILWAFKP